jgi:preprotein translocase subunit SecG
MNEMSFGMTFLLVVMIFSAIIGVVLILMQSGSADSGSGEGAAGGVFGSRGPSGFLARATIVVSSIFFVSVLGINYIGIKHPSGGNSLLQKKLESTSQSVAVPVAPSSSSETK